jgi:hypothetical protein
MAFDATRIGLGRRLISNDQRTRKRIAKGIPTR